MILVVKRLPQNNNLRLSSNGTEIMLGQRLVVQSAEPKIYIRVQ